MAWRSHFPSGFGGIGRNSTEEFFAELAEEPVSQAQQETHRLVFGSCSPRYDGGCGATVVVTDVLPVTAAVRFSPNSSWDLWPGLRLVCW